MENKIYIIGCGGHARSVADIILGNVPSAQLIFVDENARDKETIFDFPVIKSLPQEAQNIFIAIGDNQNRREISSGRKLISVIAKTAYVAPTAVIEDGCFIASGVHVGPFVHIGKGTLINTNAVVEHEVQVGEFCHLAPNTTVCGRTTIGDRVFLGAGAAVIDKICICSDVTIGAGGVVVKDIYEAGTYIGIPVKRTKDVK